MSALHSSTHPAIVKAREQSSKMSITQTFYLAHQARGKLTSEAAKSDHDLRFLVGHANLLDRLMLHLSQAEQEQDAWFNNMVSGNNSADEEDAVESKLRSWETIPEEEEIPSWNQEYSDSESDSDDEDYEDDFSLFPTLTLSKSNKSETERSFRDTVVETQEVDAEEDDEDLDDNGFYSLSRTESHRPPSLVSDESDDSEDEDTTPPSPPQPTLSAPVLSEKQRKQIVTTAYYDDEQSSTASSAEQMLDEAFYLSSRPNMVSAF